MSTSELKPREWRILETFGPVFSHGGFKNWHLCLAEDGIVALPVGFWPTLLAGIGAGTGNIWLMHKAYVKSADADGERIIVDDGNPKWRRYPAARLERVYLKFCRLGANEIHLQLLGEKNHLYGLGDRTQTDACRAKFKELYPRVYSELGF